MVTGVVWAVQTAGVAESQARSVNVQEAGGVGPAGVKL